MKEGRCFKCHKTGHMSRDHKGNAPYEDKKATDSTKKFDGFKKMAHTARAMIRNLVTDMDEDERKKAFEGMIKDADF